jgi:long-chain acyl-CoA synthetase
MTSLSQFLRRAAQINAEGVATQYLNRQTTWGQTLARVARTAGFIQQQAVPKGSMVAVLAHNSDRYLEWLFAIPWAGSVVAPLNTRWSHTELDSAIEELAPQLLVVDAANYPTLAALNSDLLANTTICCFDEIEGLHPSGDECIQAAHPLADQGRKDSDLAMICYTGGTTGRAKGAMLTHEGMYTNVMQWINAVQATRQDTLLVLPPLFHAAGAGNAFAATALACRCVFIERFDIPVVLETIASAKVTNVPLVATMLDWIVNHPDISHYDLSSWNKITYGASPIPTPVLQKALQLLPQVEFFQVYGQSEGGPTISVLAHHDHVERDTRHLRSAGQVVMGSEIAILDEQGNELGVDALGEVVVRGPGVAVGYWQQEEESQKAFSNGWLRTGDAGRIDTEGYLFIEDRIKDMIISGGENVFPAQVESALRSHPAILECAVIGIPSERWGEQVHAIVRLNPEAIVTEAELDEHMQQQLAGFKCPRSYTFRTEPFPISAANKILKRELRKEYLTPT